MAEEPHVSASPSPRIVLGVCGGIAAYKAVEVCRRLVDAGAHVVPVLTAEATRFVGAVTFSALASEPVQSSLWDEDSPIPHTRLGQQADLIVVAPATAHLMARYRRRAGRRPADGHPAGHPGPGVAVPGHAHRDVGAPLGPGEPGHPGAAGRGSRATRDRAPGRRATRARAGWPTRRPSPHARWPWWGWPGRAGRVGQGDLAGRRIVVSAGGTREPIDPVRFLTNRSSGKQGHALAEAAARRGATRHPGHLVGAGAGRRRAGRGAPRRGRVGGRHGAALAQACAAADVVVMAAAVADFRPKAVADRKLSKDEGVPELVLEPTPDILVGLVAQRPPGQMRGRIRRRDRTTCSSGAGRSWPARVSTSWSLTMSVPPGPDSTTTPMRSPSSAPTAASTEVPLTSKDAVANAVLDSVIAHQREKWSST